MALDHSINLGEAAAACGSSYQNVKRIAEYLTKDRFLSIDQDPNDRRILRLTLTEKNWTFWAEHNQEAQNYINQWLEDLLEQEATQFALPAITNLG